MARLESVAVGGYYPTPAHLVPLIADLLWAPASDKSRPFVAFDPCAGEGAAIADLVTSLSGGNRDTCGFALCIEMEKTRAEAANKTLAYIGHAHHSDAFQTTWEKPFASLLFLNPPYDLDREVARLEERFLARFSHALIDSGVLVFVVPYYALEASAETLATLYHDLRCYRFPDADFSAYKQVVLVGRRRVDKILMPDRLLLEAVRRWASDPASMPALGDTTNKRMSVPQRGEAAWAASTLVSCKDLDIVGLLKKARPWSTTDRTGGLRTIEAFVPPVHPRDLMSRLYPVAVPPRPAHIAAGMASGIFNGARVEPNAGSHLPPLLVKGVFDREFKTVEHKYNRDGELVGEVQVQQPKMVVTILDLRTHSYHTLLSGTEPTKGKVMVASMTTADLLQHYSTSLMRVMEAQCPVLYDPRYHATEIALHPSPRRLFTAQAHASRALVRLLAEPDRVAILLGEIGSGKSTVSIVAARTAGANRILILCPPHLLSSWTDQLAAIAPDCKVHVLRDVADVQSLAADVAADRDQPRVAILSREAAKLGHAFVSVTGACPKCGAAVPPGDLAKARARCTAAPYVPSSTLAHLAVELAVCLEPHFPDDPNLEALVPGRMATIRRKAFALRKKPTWRAPRDLAHRIVAEALKDVLHSEREPSVAVLFLALMVANDSKLTADVVRQLPVPTYSRERGAAVQCMMLLPSDEREQALLEYAERARLLDEKDRAESGRNYYRSEINVDAIRETFQKLDKKETFSTWEFKFSPHVDKDGVRMLPKTEEANVAIRADSAQAALLLCRKLVSISTFKARVECGEPLFQAVPEPARLPLARLISRRYPTLFDFLILDEGHEYATDGSAQERSAHRLTGLGLPTILMTGTIMNGYAESLFTNFWAISRKFRSEFQRDHRSNFVERYGYRKRLVEEKPSDRPAAFGSVTDRVEQGIRTIGNAPGVLPLFLLSHLLPMSVTLHKTDLAIDLPRCTQENVTVTASRTLLQNYNALRDKLIATIRADRFKQDRAGKLWGQLAELPSYLDRATLDVGNGNGDVFAIAYPPTVDNGSTVVSVPLLPADALLPKEEWLLETVERELAEGRNVLVFAWHIPVLPRLARLISERIGERVPILHADKVSTSKRQAWIDKEVVAKKARVMLANPVTVQTGLNNLVHFHTEVWMQNPACNPLVFRQAIGRVDRIGQTKETRILVPIYKDTLQVQANDLLMRKVAVSVSTDGLDPESALQAAGVAEDSYLVGLSIGKQLYAMLTSDEEALEDGASRPKRIAAEARNRNRSMNQAV